MLDSVVRAHRGRHARNGCVGRCTRGGCTGVGGAGWVGTRVGYTGTPSQYPYSVIFSHIPGLIAYPRPNEGNSRTFDEVSEIGY